MGNLVKLRDLKNGNFFLLDGIEFIKLGSEGDCDFILTKNFIERDHGFLVQPFERKKVYSNNFSENYISKELALWIGDHPKILERIISFPLSLVALNGAKPYDDIFTHARLLTFDEYRTYRKYIPCLGKPYWLATPWNVEIKYLCIVEPDGTIDCHSTRDLSSLSTIEIRPSFYIKNDTYVYTIDSIDYRDIVKYKLVKDCSSNELLKEILDRNDGLFVSDISQACYY